MNRVLFKRRGAGKADTKRSAMSSFPKPRSDANKRDLTAGNQLDTIIDVCIEWGLFLPITLARRQRSYAIRALAMIFNLTMWLPVFMIVGAPTILLIAARLFVACIED